MSAFNKKIRLLALEPAPGVSEPKIIDSAAMATNATMTISDVGTVTKLEAMAAGINAELTAVMWRREFRDFTHAEYGGVRYRIVQTGSAANTLHIKLTLERG